MNRSPTIDTLGVVLVVFLLQLLFSLIGLGGLFVLAPPITADPVTIVTSIYAHASLGHLIANSVVLVVAGFAVERRTTWLRFHLFFIAVGALAGVAQVVGSGLVGPATSVLGASGAVFGLVGYLLAGNTVSTTLLDRLRLSPRVQVALYAVAALAVTVLTGRPGVALVAHFTGLFVGLLAGAAGVLDTSSAETEATSTRHGRI
jgi:membrane associated rhomboid family serine protease